MVGQSADFTCFSFQAIKHLTTVDGGALAVKKKSDYKRGKLLRWYGIDREKRSQENRIEIDVKEWGYKFHMNDVCATIGLENIKFLEKLLKAHRANAEYYKKQLQGIKKIQLLSESSNLISSYWLFTIKVDNRKKFFEYMSAKNIMVSQVHRRNDTHSVVKEYRKHLPGVDEFTKHMICIPVGWWLTKAELQYIVDTIKKANQ
jgi:dTDP-4-amino-4,6-dideoxygalactose transaminase